MTSHYALLGITPTASPAEIKAAYHAKLREFPAHRYPQEFKAIRAAYDAIRQGQTAPSKDFFQVRPLQPSLDPDALQQLRERLANQLAVSLEDLLRETF